MEISENKQRMARGELYHAFTELFREYVQLFDCSSADFFLYSN